MSPDEVELIYELSPMQQAMVFHSLLAPGSGVYVIQMSLRLTGRLETSAFLRAWQRVIERHGILRTAFFWEGLEKPLQVVYRQVDLPVRRESWRGLDPGEQRARLASFLESERDRGLDLTEAPLMRVALFELAEGVRQMVWTLHHVLVDGWSQGQLLRELFTCYAAFAQGGEPRLAPAGSFRDYIAWLQRQDPGEAEAFWRKSLAGFDTPTLLAGGDGGPPAWREARRRDLRLAAGATAALREAARRHRLTVNTLVQGAWSLLLAQASGREDVVFGTTVAGRPAELPGVESTLGLFINTQPVRVPVRPEERLWSWLAALQERQVETRRYEHSALVDVQRWSELPAGVPLFDHLLVFENLAMPAELERPVPGLEIAEEAAHDLTNYPLSVVVIPGPELLLTIRYDAARFDAPDVARMLERLARLLEAFAEDRDLALDELPRLLPAERHQALVEWNDTARPYDEAGACLHELVARQAERTPLAVAASFEGAELTYRELESHASRLARHLTGLGVRRDGRVGVRMERSLEMIVALLGTMKAGAAYVPLDPTWPEERLQGLIESAGISVVLGKEGTLTPGPSAPALDPDNLAYVLYTSGSTGTPKGVMIPHRGIVNRLLWMQEAYGLTPGDRVLQKTPFSFDVSLWEFFWPLLVGARLVLAKPEGHRDPAYLVDLIAREKITTLHFVPSMLQAFLEAPRLESLSGLRRVMASGEALPPDLVRRFFARLPWVELHNLYGPTEASVDVSSWACVPEPPRSLVPIGRPIANLRLHVADRDLRPLPIGIPGELLLGGAGLARGYLGRPELTAAAFVPDPFGEEPGGRLYRTGDLTRFLADGNVEYLGRIDHQVKIRGFRIELGEIEAVLAGHPAVRECVVLARRDLSGSGGADPRLVAYVALDPTGPTDSSDVKSAFSSWLRAKLPEHMVPAAFVFLESLPLTTSGKVDRKALPAPEKPSADAAAYVAPADPVEELLAGTWADVLGVDRVGVHDDFFALGGHSLLATQVASRIREAFGVEIPLRHLFEAPTVAGLAERIDARAAALADREALLALLGDLELLSEEEAWARLEDPDGLRAMARSLGPSPSEPKQALPAAPVPLPRPAGTAELPLSFAQQRLWFLDQLEPDSPAYNIPLPVRFQGELPVPILERIAGEIVRRHETLRTTFAAREGQPVQVVHPEVRPGLPMVDLSALPDAEREARRIAQDEALRPFDLRTGPLLRLTVVRVAGRDHLLLVTLHHIIADGWSMRVLLREVAALFEASPLPALPFQYADFAVWQRQWLEGEVLEEQLAFWKDRLAGAPQVLELPTDRPRPPVQTARGAATARPLAPAVSAAVRELCRREDVTPFMALLAAWAVLLGRHADQEDLLVGTPVAGRHARGTEHLIGFFANTLVLRIEPKESSTFQALLGQVRQAALEAFSHQDLPFERLVEELVPARDLSRSPLFQAMFVLQDTGGEGWSMPGLTIQPVPLAGQTSKFDILLTLTDRGTGFTATLEHSTDLFDGDRMVRLLQGFEVLLAGAAAAPERTLAALPLLTVEERNRLLQEWNANAVEHLRVCVHEPVEEQVERTPDRLAAVWAEDGTGLTYRELDRRANRLAHHLRALGVGPDERVPICLERSLDLLVAVLGVLKAGGAYVPIDPDYPADRVAFMLADSRSRVLVTTSDVAAGLPGLDPEQGILPVLLDADRDAIAACSGGTPVRRTTPDHLAYVIYTSGSTGRPKGVAMPHGVLSNLLMWQRGASVAEPASRTLQFASLSFDPSFHEIFSSWWMGGTVVAVPQETRRDVTELCRVLAGQEIARLFLPFVALQQIAEAGEHGAPLPAGLQEIITAGEQLQITPQIVGWLESTRAVLENHYGPTEGHVVTMHRLSGPPGAWPALPPIGRPLPNVRTYLLDRRLEPVPQGVPGHLFFGGAQVVRGYLDRPELTAEKFIPDPFGGEPGARLYATGDLARHLADGALQYIGRIDQQVKIRGFRVEPGEVEAVLARHPAVRKSAVVVRGEGPDKRLVGYYVADAPLESEALRAFLREELPEHMVPALLVHLDALPLTPSGKLDRKALPAPEVEDIGAGHVAPRDPVEELLAGIWAEVLGRRGVGIRDDFFSLGGHSLLATQVISRIRGTLGVELPLRQLFETPTVEGFARAARAAGPGEPPAPPIVPVPREDGDLPLSFAQQRLWLIDQLEPGTPAYDIPLAVRLVGEVAPELLERCFAEIVRRHEILRTTFEVRAGGPVQVIAPAESFRTELKRLDLSHLPEGVREARARALARDEARWSFDLRRGPLWRLVLARLGEREHLLLLTLHHIITDGWSMGVLLREIASLHEAFSRGRPSPLPELPVQYADFAVWQRSWLQREVLEAQLGYWTRRLDGAPQILELPTDRPRPAVQTFRGAARSIRLSPALSEAVLGLGRRRGVTLFMTLLAAWSAVLGRLAGQDDLLVGTPIAGRNRREIEDLIGFFVNTLVLRAEPGPESTFGEMLGRVRETTLEAFSHQDLPFERLVEELVPQRDLSRPPLFQVLFALQSFGETREIPGLSLHPVPLEGETAKLDLSLVFSEAPAGLVGVLEHNTDLFDGSTIERLLQRFAAVLEGAVGDPGRPLADLSWLLAGERQQVLVELNDTSREVPREATLTEVFAARAAAAPDAPAVVDATGEVWSYRRLDEASSRLARHLTRLGVEPGGRVGVAMERSADLVVALLAILKAGAAYVPLDPAYPDERLAFLIGDAEVGVVLVEERARERMAALRSPTLLLSLESLKSLPQTGGEPALPRMPAGSLAYVIYTSGSTGRPKGVAVPHRAILQLVFGTPDLTPRPDDRLAFQSNTSFDAATWEIWGPLLHGAALVVVAQDILLEPRELAGLLRRERVTALFFTTPLFNRVARHAPEVLGSPSLRLALFGGEASDPVAVAQALERARPERLLHMYGPTESTTFATCFPVEALVPGAATVPIGRPLGAATAHVLDRSGQPAALGQPGELFLGGGGLAWGYLGRPDLTAELFVPDPWASEAGGRLYRTGDLVRRRWDGALEFQGRIDQQVKIRGFRIEPGEVETLLASHPEVAACAVLARRDGPAGDVRLVAYVVPVAGAELTGETLRGDLKRTLPDYMLPSVTVFLDALPLTPNGKVDRRALPAPGVADVLGGDAAGFAAPSDPAEEGLAAIWADVLGLDEVGVDNDFFALGGHSLLATQVISRVREEMGLELPLRALFEAPTIRQLALRLRAARPAGRSVPALAAGTEGSAPLSFAQQRLWFLDQLEPDSPVYNIPLAVRLTGELSEEVLERTFAEVVRRHAALRTTFTAEGGEPVQEIAPPETTRPELRVLDLSDAPEEARDEWAHELALEEARAPFDLRRGPLLRLGLLRLNEREHLLLATLHHIVADGWSMGVLLREVGSLYTAFLQGEPSPLPELPLQYADFARWQRSWLQGRVLEEQLAYWRQKLAGAPALLELPTDRPRPAVQTYRGASVGRALPQTLAAAVHELCRREGVTPFMLLLAAWAVLLGRLAGQDDVLVGSPIAGRNRREIEDLIGFFVNTLVLRSDLSGDPGFGELLERVRATALEAFTHQDLPFERIVEEVVLERDLAHPPLVQVLFALQNAPGQGLSVPGLSLTPVSVDAGVAKLDLSLVFWEEEQTFAGALEHNTDLFDRGTAERILARFQVLLEGAAGEPGRSLRDLPLLLDGEREQVLAEPAAPPRLATIPALFAAAAAAAPQAPAVVFAGEPAETLSYAEVDRRSALWAGELRELGVGPEARVGLCVRRSPRMVVGLLAVLRAGGAYVPLDPAWPEERLAWMLDDAGVELVLTEEGTAERLPRRTARPVRRLFLEDGPHPRPLSHEWERGVGLEAAGAAYVIYTSGSTGRPKGVVATHGGLAAFSQALAGVMALRPDDRVLQFASLSFDAAAVALYPPLVRGAAVVLHPEPAALTPRELVALCATQGLTVLELPAALWRLAVQEAEAAGLRFGPAVRLFMTGGESLAPEALRQWGRSVDPEARLVSSYGPTEATVVATVYQASGAEAVETSLAGSPLGQALPGTAVYLLDARLAPVPVDMPGEIFLGGAGVTRGYLGRPDLTAAAFLPDPWGPPGGRIYRTGDRARRRHGETGLGLEFLGRVDQQLKIRGFRIEPGEIEAVLGGHPAVREAVVQARENVLVGYVAIDRTDPTDRSDPRPLLATWLRERLPDYMVPSAFVVLDALPLTPTGKVDRKALPDPDRRADEAAWVAPRDRTEELLAGIFQEVLRLDRVGVHDDFFKVGGHSLLATQVITRIREAMGVAVPLRRVFEAPTIAGLARALGGGLPEEGAPVQPAEPVEVIESVPAPPRRTEQREISIRLAGLSADKRQLLDAVLRELRAEPAAVAPITPREDRAAPVPLSFSQERMWFLHLLDPASAVYNVFLGVRLDGALRSGILAAAFTELTRRHRILVTRYELSGAAPVQVTDPGGPFRLPRIDLSALPPERRAEELDRRQAEESGRPFDLVHGPVLRATLIHLASAESMLLLAIHHIAIDGWSLRILLNELAVLYAAFAAGEPSPLPAPPLQYADYAVWQRRQSGVLEAQRAWWRRQLEPPLPVLGLPTDRPRQVPQPFRLATEEVAIPAGLTADLHALAAGRGASLFMLLLAGLAAVLHRTGGDERILVGTPVAGRNRREVEGLVGFFLNTLVLRVDLDGDPGFGTLLQDTARMALEAFSHQDLPLEMLLQELRIEKEDAGRGPFQVMLLVQNLRRLRIEVPGLTLTGLTGERQVDLGTAVFELGLTVEEHGSGLTAAMSYNALLFEASTIQRLLGHLRTLLGGAVADPGVRLSDLPLLSPAEQEEVRTWNPPVSAVFGDPVPVLFAARAARTPDAEALRQGGRRMTYAELDRRTREIAGRLRAAGVGPEVPVAVFLERSPELIAAFLGVLRAGGVYAPLDPALPAERLAWILEDLAPAALITDSALAGRISWTGPTLCLDSSDEVDRGAIFPAPSAAQGAYIIYTSGSTGRPKGVVVPHGALSSFVAAARDLYGIGPEDRVLQFAALGFDTSVEEIYPCLTAGGTLVLRTDEMAGSIAGFLRGCEDQGITVLDLPTAFWHELVTGPELAERGLPAAVRAVILGGERPLPERVAAWLRETDPRVRLFNTYGPTEATVVATAAELAPDLAAESWREVSMGRPLPGVRAHVLDRGLRPVPVGVPGELVLGGNGLARGYLGRPDLTAERFVPDPFPAAPGTRLYRTGDLARRRADGSLEFAGRVDNQVKIRGFRVEPGEVEAVLAACPEVGEIAVVAREDLPGDLRLVAYVAPTPGRKASAVDLRAFLESRLPAWMIPAAFVPLTALPRTPAGKIDRRALPAPDGTGLELERPCVAPRNEIEEAIVEIWREALRVERLGVFDSFFELGGNSLLLLQVMRRLRETFDLEVPLRSIFEERTVAALAKKVEELLIQEIQQLA